MYLGSFGIVVGASLSPGHHTFKLDDGDDSGNSDDYEGDERNDCHDDVIIQYVN